MCLWISCNWHFGLSSDGVLSFKSSQAFWIVEKLLKTYSISSKIVLFVPKLFPLMLAAKVFSNGSKAVKFPTQSSNVTGTGTGAFPQWRAEIWIWLIVS